MLGLYAPSQLGSVAFAACFFSWALFEVAVNLRLWRPGSVNRDAFSRYLIIGGMLLSFVLAMAATRVAPLDFAVGRSGLFWLGLGLMAAGLLFRLYAIRQLGQYFVPEVSIQPGQRVIDQGLYRYLRHPSYTGTFITILGYALALGNWLSLLVMVLLPGL